MFVSVVQLSECVEVYDMALIGHTCNWFLSKNILV